jgi:hypothetical protein
MYLGGKMIQISKRIITWSFMLILAIALAGCIIVTQADNNGGNDNGGNGNGDNDLPPNFFDDDFSRQDWFDFAGAHEYIIEIGRNFGFCCEIEEGNFRVGVWYIPKCEFNVHSVTIRINEHNVLATFYQYWCCCRSIIESNIEYPTDFDIDGRPGDYLEIRLSTPRGVKNLSITVPHRPVIERTPWFFTPNDDFTVNWRLTRNATFQWIYFYGTAINRDSYIFRILRNNVRSFIIPSYTVPSNYHRIDIGLENFAMRSVDNVILVMAEHEYRIFSGESSQQVRQNRRSSFFIYP